MAKPNKPPVFTSLVFELFENSDTGTLVISGLSYLRDDKNETFNFTYDDPSGLFSVDSSTGDISFVGNPESIDYESGTTSYDLQITVTDSGGNVVTETVTIQLVDLDETPPTTPSLDLDPRYDTGLSDADDITSNTLPKIAGSADAGTTIDIYDNGVLVGSTTTKNNGAWSFAFGQPLSEGEHNISVKAVNAANIESAEVSLQITIDTTAPNPPVITAIEDDNGPIPDDAVTNDPTLLIKGTSEANSGIEIFDGNRSLGTTTTDSNGDWVFDYTGTALSDGVYTITAVATDLAGNQSTASTPFQFTIDTAAPLAPTSLSLFDETSGIPDTDNTTEDMTPTIIGLAEAGARVRLFDTDGVTLLGETNADAITGEWSITATEIA